MIELLEMLKKISGDVMALNDIHTFGEWVRKICNEGYTVNIPDYQRTYSWDEKNAETLLNDLLNNQEYFLGLFLLEINSNKEYSLIDGQQRFTTLFMLLFVLHKIFGDKARFNINEDSISVKDWVYYSPNVPRLSLQKEQNGEFFKRVLTLGHKEITGEETKYFSQKNIKNVLSFFYQMIEDKTINEDNLSQIMNTIASSKVLLHSANNTGQAMQIFELLNDRGKTLTQLESLKSFIMHEVYIKSENDEKVRQNHLDTVKKYFSEIYKCLNEIHNISNKDFHEDDILRYHYIAFEKWGNQKDYRNVKDNLKDIFYKIDNIEDLKNKTESIEISFSLIKRIMKKAHNNPSNHPWLKNLYILNRMATFYPLLMSIESKYDDLINDICNYLEIFTYRAFGIMNRRTDTALHSFYSLANKISNDKVEKDQIIKEIVKIINKEVGESKENLFEDNLNDPLFYHYQQGIDGRYILLKYENYTQKDKAKGYEEILIRDLNEITNFKKKTKDSLSIEHIIAQDLVKSEEDYIRKITQGSDKDKNITNWWKETGYTYYDYKKNYFKDNFLNALGNLVISKGGANSGKGNAKPDEKNWSSFETQNDILNTIESNQTKRGNNKWRRETPFNVDDIIERQRKIIEFAKKYWSHKYFEEIETEKIKKRDPLI